MRTVKGNPTIFNTVGVLVEVVVFVHVHCDCDLVCSGGGAGEGDAVCCPQLDLDVIAEVCSGVRQGGRSPLILCVVEELSIQRSNHKKDMRKIEQRSYIISGNTVILKDSILTSLADNNHGDQQ